MYNIDILRDIARSFDRLSPDKLSNRYFQDNFPAPNSHECFISQRATEEVKGLGYKCIRNTQEIIFVKYNYAIKFRVFGLHCYTITPF